MGSILPNNTTYIEAVRCLLVISGLGIKCCNEACNASTSGSAEVILANCSTVLIYFTPVCFISRTAQNLQRYAAPLCLGLFCQSNECQSVTFS